MRQPVSGVVLASSFDVPPGVAIGDAMYCMVSYRMEPWNAGAYAVWPESEDDELAGDYGFFFNTGNVNDSSGHYVEISRYGFLHDGRSSYSWSSRDGIVSVSYVFIPQPNLEIFPQAGLDSLLTLRLGYNGDGSTPALTGDTVSWYDPPSGPFYANPALSPAVWLTRVYAYADDSNSTVLCGAPLVEDAKPYLELITAGEYAGYWRLLLTSTPNPASGTLPPVEEPSWYAPGWVVHGLGLPPLRNAQRDDNRGHQRTSRQLSNRNAAYL
jgi:hypothetical protein